MNRDFLKVVRTKEFELSLDGFSQPPSEVLMRLPDNYLYDVGVNVKFTGLSRVGRKRNALNPNKKETREVDGRECEPRVYGAPGSNKVKQEEPAGAGTPATDRSNMHVNAACAPLGPRVFLSFIYFFRSENWLWDGCVGK